MDEDDVPAAAVMAAGAAARALMRSDAGGEAALVDELAAAAIGVAQRFCGRAVVAEGWDSTPAPVRHGIAMLVQHLFEDRDGGKVPPAAVAALWRPYRAVRLL